MRGQNIFTRQQVYQRRGSSGSAIPDELSFDKIISGQTCPPCTTRDFMAYLLYVERSAENLQFFLWLRDFERRWEALGQSEKDLSPPVDPSAFSQLEASGDKALPLSPGISLARDVLAQSDFGKRLSHTSLLPRSPRNVFTPAGSDRTNPFGSSPRTLRRSSDITTDTSASGIQASSSLSPWPWTEGIDNYPNYVDVASEAYASADVKWQPFTIQPFREEICRIIALYVAEGAPRELNITTRERISVLHALAHTTHPSAFTLVKQAIEMTLRFQAHPNFIQWTLCNATKTRVICARTMGAILFALGCLIVILMVLNRRGRAWRLFAIILWFIGITIGTAAWNGICILLQGFSHRHIQPWELWDSSNTESGLTTQRNNHLDPLNEYANSYEDRPWLARYKKTNLFRRIFWKEVVVEDRGLRRLQASILRKCMLNATIICAIMCAIVLAIPPNH